MAILVSCQQGSDDWLRARAGACTASRFSVARSWTGGLTDQQARYVAALRAGQTDAQALAAGGYQKRPTFAALDDALAGKKIGGPSEAALKYAQLLAIERIAGEPLDDTFQTWAMRRGQELEPIARAIYMERTGYVVEESGVLLSDDRRFGYSTDGEVYGHRGGIEIKCPMASDKVAGVWIDPEPVINEYMDQIDGGMWLAVWDWIDLVVYTPWLASVGKELFVRRIHRDEARIEALEADLIAFQRIVGRYEAQLRGLPEPALSDPLPPWEPVLAKDQCKPLSAALSATPEAPLLAREAAAAIPKLSLFKERVATT